MLTAFLLACAAAAQPSGGEIAGRVLNAVTGAPVRRATVELSIPPGTYRPGNLIAVTGAEGRFRFLDLPPGTYRLAASRSGFLKRSFGRGIPLNPNERLTVADTRLTPGAVISGRVLDEDSEPMDRARVLLFKQVYRDGGQQWDRVNTDCQANDTGEFRVPDLRPGRYLLQAYSNRPASDNRFTGRPERIYIPTYYRNAPGRQAAASVEVGPGEEVRGIDIQLVRIALPPSVRIRGKVVGAPAGTEIAVAAVRADGGYGGGGTSVASAPDYAFEVTAEPGQWILRANVYTYGRNFEAFAEETLAVTGDVAGVVLAMSPAPVVTGRITVAEGGCKVKLEGVRVAMPNRELTLHRPEAKSDPAGKLTFTEPFRPGPYSIVVDPHSLPENCFVQRIALDGQEVLPHHVEIRTSAQLEILLSRTAGSITGSATDHDGKPVPNAVVTVSSADNRSRPVKQSAAGDGSFKLANLRPGKYRLFAWEEVDDDLWQDPDFCKKYETRSTEVTVAPGETRSAQLRVIPAGQMN